MSTRWQGRLAIGLWQRRQWLSVTIYNDVIGVPLVWLVRDIYCIGGIGHCTRGTHPSKWHNQLGYIMSWQGREGGVAGGTGWQGTLMEASNQPTGAAAASFHASTSILILETLQPHSLTASPLSLSFSLSPSLSQSVYHSLFHFLLSVPIHLCQCPFYPFLCPSVFLLAFMVPWLSPLYDLLCCLSLQFISFFFFFTNRTVGISYSYSLP